MSFIVTHYSQLNKPLESYIAVGGKSSMTTVKALWDPSSPQSMISAETIDLINPLQKSKEKFVSKDIIIEKEFFSVNVSLSDEITFIDVSFMKADLPEKKVDIVIGNNIISRGNFEIINYDNLVEFSFRIQPQDEFTN